MMETEPGAHEHNYDGPHQHDEDRKHEESEKLEEQREQAHPRLVPVCILLSILCSFVGVFMASC